MSMITFRLAREQQQKKRQAQLRLESPVEPSVADEVPAAEKEAEEVASEPAEQKPVEVKPVEAKPVDAKPTAPAAATVKPKPSIASRK